jgi:hypothetical protein
MGLVGLVIGCAAGHEPNSNATGVPDGMNGSGGGATTGSGGNAQATSGSGGDSAVSVGSGGGGMCAPSMVPAPGNCAALGVQIAPEFADIYSCVDLGTLVTVPSPWGGFAIKYDNPGQLLITGSARSAEGRIYAVSVGRDKDCHIAGFTGTSSSVAEAPYNEAGVAYGPGDVLFLAQAVVNQLGQLKPGSNATDKVVDLTVKGIDDSICGVGFVPSGFEAEGQMKLTDWPMVGSWYSASYSADGSGTFNIDSITKGPELPGGAAGFVFIEGGNEKFPHNSVLISEYDTGSVVAYDLTAESNPNLSTARPFITGLTGAQGGVVDPVSGDFLFSTFAEARLVAVRGFKPPPPLPK